MSSIWTQDQQTVPGICVINLYNQHQWNVVIGLLLSIGSFFFHWKDSYFLKKINWQNLDIYDDHIFGSYVHTAEPLA